MKTQNLILILVAAAAAYYFYQKKAAAAAPAAAADSSGTPSWGSSLFSSGSRLLSAGLSSILNNHDSTAGSAGATVTGAVNSTNWDSYSPVVDTSSSDYSDTSYESPAWDDS